MIERELLEPDGWIRVVERWQPDDVAIMQALVAELPLRQESIVIAGKTYATPRLTSWHGDPAAVYRYSGRTFVPEAWTPGLARIRDRLRVEVHPALNACLTSYYRDGGDAMGAHSDDEPELGPDAPRDVIIASLSLGAPRRFVLAPKAKARAAERRVLELGHGALLVMGGALQQHWRHHVPRTARPVGPRLNLTFRIVRGRVA